MGYEEHQPSISPFKDEAGQAWAAKFGAAKDGVADRTREATLAHFPSRGPADALGLIGTERGIERGTSESDAAYRVRVAGAWAQWLRAGGPLSLLDALAGLGYTSANGNPVIVQQNGRGFTRTSGGALVTTTLAPNAGIAGSPPWWWIDSNFSFWSRFCVLFPSVPTGWTSISATPSSATAPTLDEVDTLRRVIRRWKPATRTCMGIYVLVAGKWYGWPTTQVWGAATGNWGSSTVVVWSP